MSDEPEKPDLDERFKAEIEEMEKVGWDHPTVPYALGGAAIGGVFAWLIFDDWLWILLGAFLGFVVAVYAKVEEQE